jgi:hypothetical protein
VTLRVVDWPRKARFRSEHHHVYTLAISVESCKLSKVSIHGTNRLKYDVFTRE